MPGIQTTRKAGILLAATLAATTYGFGQLKFPGGITIGGPPRQAGRANVPDNRRPERPDPDSVCPKVVDWFQILQNEYPGVDLPHTQGAKIQQMAVPLFSDAVFQKQFGVSYPKMTDTERRDFFRTHLIPCQTSRQYSQQTILVQVLNAPFMPGTASILSPAQLIPALDRLDIARSTLNADEQKLQSSPASADTYDQASALSDKRKDELARVWPSEKTRFQTAVKDAVGRSAAAAVQAKIQPLLSAPASPQAARQLRDATRTYSALFQAVPDGQRTALQTKLDDRRTAMLREMLPPQKARAEAFPATRQGLDDGAEWFAAYQGVFLDPPVLPEAAALATAYLNRREAALASMAPQFRQKIEAAQDAGNVASMYDEVFRLPDDRQTDTYRQLATARAARAALLDKRAEAARMAAEEKAEKAALLRGDIVASSLKVNNLENAQIYRAIYIGDFAHAGIERTNVFYVDMFDSYLQTFGNSCQANLPPDKVMITEKECVRSQHWVNGYGAQTSPDTCVEWDRKPTGAYADPRAFAAKVSLEDASLRNGMRSFLQVLARPDALNSAMGQAGDMVRQGLSLKQDMPRLIAGNGCGSKALARLQENMTRFANGEDPMHVAGFAPDATKATRAQDLDARALADDLIRANAAGWLMNRYTGLRGVQVDDNLDPEGRPRRIHASYDQKGVTGNGSVDIAFVDGVPSCLYFSDDPGNCKAPSPTVLNKYESGDYRRKAPR